MTKRDYKAEFENQLAQSSIAPPLKELMFAKSIGRKWRFDYAWVDELLAVEYEGIYAGKSRHLTVQGFTEDCIKYDTAVILGWRVLRVTAPMVDSGRALVFVRQALGLEDLVVEEELS